MQSGPQPPSAPNVLGVFLRIDTDTDRVVVRGEFRRHPKGWEIELRSPDGHGGTYRAVHRTKHAGVIGWLMGLLDHEPSTLAR